MTANTHAASDSTRISYGRGGAGNISKKAADNPTDLITPTIKSPTYTTGRGGTGNMAKNDPANPAIARQRQDLASLPRRMSEGESHFGRGGAANTIRPSAEEVARAREENARIEMAAREAELNGKGKGKVGGGGEREARGLADVGKEFLVKGVGR